MNTRISPTDGTPYQEMMSAYINNGRPTQLTYAGYVWRTLDDNGLVFIQLRAVSNMDEHYGGQTTFGGKF